MPQSKAAKARRNALVACQNCGLRWPLWTYLRPYVGEAPRTGPRIYCENCMVSGIMMTREDIEDLLD